MSESPRSRENSPRPNSGVGRLVMRFFAPDKYWQGRAAAQREASRSEFHKTHETEIRQEAAQQIEALNRITTLLGVIPQEPNSFSWLDFSKNLQRSQVRVELTEGSSVTVFWQAPWGGKPPAVGVSYNNNVASRKQEIWESAGRIARKDELPPGEHQTVTYRLKRPGPTTFAGTILDAMGGYCFGKIERTSNRQGLQPADAVMDYSKAPTVSAQEPLRLLQDNWSGLAQAAGMDLQYEGATASNLLHEEIPTTDLFNLRDKALQPLGSESRLIVFL